MCRLRCFNAADKVAAGVEVVWPKGDTLEAGEGVGDDLEELGYDGAADAPEDCYIKELSVKTGIWVREGETYASCKGCRTSPICRMCYEPQFRVPTSPHYQEDGRWE